MVGRRNIERERVISLPPGAVMTWRVLLKDGRHGASLGLGAWNWSLSASMWTWAWSQPLHSCHSPPGAGCPHVCTASPSLVTFHGSVGLEAFVSAPQKVLTAPCCAWPPQADLL